LAEPERGVREVLRRRDLAIDLTVLECGGEGLVDTQQALADHVNENSWPDAILGGNGQMSIAALKWVLAQGL
jgi:hypothetical protein